MIYKSLSQFKLLLLCLSFLHPATSLATSDLVMVIADLNQAFQSDLTIPDKKLAQMKSLLDKQSIDNSMSPEDKSWINSYGKDLIARAKNVEYAWNTLEYLGLRRRLISLSESQKEYSLSWWMNKEPLRSFPVGQGSGKTARELGIDFVAHETKNLHAYESMISQDHLNALISRENTRGETANPGLEGFYTLKGDVGKRDMDRFGIGSTGITVRLFVNPSAREGTDFLTQGGQIIIRNKNAVRVIPERLNLKVFEYFRALERGYDFGPQRKASREQLKRVYNAELLSDPKKLKAMLTLVRENKNHLRFMTEWFSLPVSQKYPELMDEFLSKASVDDILWVIELSLHLEHWKNHPELIEKLLAKNNDRIDAQLIKFIFSKKYWHSHPEWVDTVLSRKEYGGLKRSNYIHVIEQVLSQNDADERPEWKIWVNKLLSQAENESLIYHLLETYLFSNQNLPIQKEWVETVKEKRRIEREERKSSVLCQALFSKYY